MLERRVSGNFAGRLGKKLASNQFVGRRDRGEFVVRFGLLVNLLYMVLGISLLKKLVIAQLVGEKLGRGKFVGEMV